MLSEVKQKSINVLGGYSQYRTVMILIFWLVSVCMVRNAFAEEEHFDRWKALTLNFNNESQIQGFSELPHVLLSEVLFLGKVQVIVPEEAMSAIDSLDIEYVTKSDNYQDYLNYRKDMREYHLSQGVNAYTQPRLLRHPFSLPIFSKTISEPKYTPQAFTAGVLDSAWYSTFPTYGEVVEKLDALSETYNGIGGVEVERFNIGYTHEGRYIEALHITQPGSGPPKPALLLRGAIHAAEQVAAMSVVYFAEAILAFYAAQDPSNPYFLRLQELFNKLDFYILPVQNPDGYEYINSIYGNAQLFQAMSQTQQKNILNVRKNRHNYQETNGVCGTIGECILTTSSGSAKPCWFDSECDIAGDICYRPGGGMGAYIGTELNRNFDTTGQTIDWCGAMAEPDYCSRDYCGPNAFSELETTALKTFIENHPNIRGDIDHHSYAQWLMIPYYHQSGAAAPHGTIYSDIYKSVHFAISSVHGLDFEPLGYSLGGSSTDWMYDEHKIWSIGYEGRPDYSEPYPDSFRPDIDPNDPITLRSGEELMAGSLVFAEWLVQDPDGDGIVNAWDNCISIHNVVQRDCDGDFIGDACDSNMNACEADIFLVMDRSGSMTIQDDMSLQDRGEHAREGANAYLSSLGSSPPGLDIGLIQFGVSPQCFGPNDADFGICGFYDLELSSNPNRLVTQVNTMYAPVYGQRTALLDGVLKAVEDLDYKTEESEYIFILSDGIENNSVRVPPDDPIAVGNLIDRIQSQEIVISALAVTQEADYEHLMMLVGASGGAIGSSRFADINTSASYLRQGDVFLANEPNQTANAFVAMTVTTMGGGSLIPLKEVWADDGPGPMLMMMADAKAEGDLRYEPTTFNVEDDATDLHIVLTNKGYVDETAQNNATNVDWDIDVTLTRPDGTLQTEGITEIGEGAIAIHVPNPPEGEWTLALKAMGNGELKSNLTVAVRNPYARFVLHATPKVPTDGESVTVTPTVTYKEIPIDVNQIACKANLIGPAGAVWEDIPLTNTPERIADRLPPQLILNNFNGRGFYRVEIQCEVPDGAATALEEQEWDGVNGFTHTATTTIYLDSTVMPPCKDGAPANDCDNDGIIDSEECGGDSDDDGWPGFYDSDSDNDEINDGLDNCPCVPNSEQQDSDDDGIGNVCDTEDFPVALCQDVIVQAGQSCVTNASIDDGSYDPDGGSVTLDLTPPSPFAIGTTFVTLLVEDVDGNIDSCQGTVTVKDSTLPELICPADVVLQCPADTSPTNTGMATYSDNCGILSVTYTDNTTPGCTGTDSVVREWVATDIHGNVNICSQTIQVDDTTSPSLNVNSADPLTLECGLDDYVEYGAEAQDTCDLNVTASVAGDVNPDIPETYTVFYSATDDCGNTAFADRNVVVEDTTAPDLTCPSDVSLTCPADTDPLNTGIATAEDACSNFDVNYLDTETPLCGGTKRIVREWIAQDNYGNESSCIQQIDVADTTPPVVSIFGQKQLVLECHVDDYVEHGADAIDSCEGPLQVTVEGDTVDNHVPGTYIVEYRAEDDCGNVGLAYRTIVVQDTISPEITLGGNTNARSCSIDGDDVQIARATASDICAGDILVVGRVIESTNPTMPVPFDVIGNSVRLAEGTYTIEWSAVDPSGNASSETETIEVYPGLAAKLYLDLRDRVKVVNHMGQAASITNTGYWKTYVRNDATAGTVLSRASVEILDRVHIFGDVTSQSWISLGDDTEVGGDINRFTNIWVSPPPTTTPVFPQKTGDIELEPDTSLTISPGSYGDVIIKPRATLTLLPGPYFVENLDVEPESRLKILDTSEVFVKTSWIQRGEIDGAENSHFTYSSTSQLVVESDLNTHLSAGNAHVMVRAHVSGTLTAKYLTVDAGETLTCVPCTDCESF